MDNIFLTVSLFPAARVYALVRESGPASPARLCEVGSQMVQKHFASLPYKGKDASDVDRYRKGRYQQFLDDARRLQTVLDENVSALLDEADRKALAATAGDRIEASHPDVGGSRELEAIHRRIDEV